MKRFKKQCPMCGNEADCETKDSRNMLECAYCGFKTTLINANRIQSEVGRNEDKDLKTNLKNYAKS